MPPHGQRKAAFRENKISVSSSNGPHYEGAKNNRGSPDGVGREISGDNKIIYVGSFKEGKRDGTGIYYGTDGIIYRVQYDKGNQIGLGTITYPDGGVYAGYIKDYEPSGYGIYRKTADKISCEGFFEKDGKGLGKYKSNQIFEYSGELKNFKPEGLGCNHFHSVDFYCGKFTNYGDTIIGKMNTNDNRSIKWGNFTRDQESFKYSVNGFGIRSFIPPTSFLTNKRYLQKGMHKNDRYDGYGVERYENTEKYYKFKGSEKKSDLNSQEAKDFEKQVDDAVKDAIQFAEEAKPKADEAKKKVKDANTAKDNAEKVAKEADAQAKKFEEENKARINYEKAKAAATPTDVDFQNVGVYEFPSGKMYKKMYEGTLGKDDKPYGYGTIKYIHDGKINFQGSFVDGGKNLLGKGSQIGFYEFDGNNLNEKKTDILENDKANIETEFIKKAIDASKKATEAEKQKKQAEAEAEKQKKQAEAEAAYKKLVEAEIPKPFKLVYGHVITATGIYDGGVNDTGEPHGLGKMVYNNTEIYEGTFLKGSPHGLGKKTIPNKSPLFGIFDEITCTKSKDGSFNIQTKNKTPEFIEVFKTNINKDINNRLVEVEQVVKKAHEEAKKEANQLYDKAMGEVVQIIDERKGSVGIIPYSDGVYKGDVEDGKAHGYGQMTLASGAFFRGVYDNGKPKFGKYVYTKVNVKFGFFQDNYDLSGICKFQNTYSDEFKNGNCSGTKFADNMCGKNKALIEVIKEKLEPDVEGIAKSAENAAIAAQKKFDAEEREMENNKKTETENAFNKNVSALQTKFSNAFTNLETDFEKYIKKIKFDAAEGEIKNANAKKYEGEKNEKDLPHGLGKMILKDDLGTYTGEFQNGIANGLGKWISSKGYVYTGDFKNGAPNGSVIFNNTQKTFESKGDFLSSTDLTRTFGFGTKKFDSDEYKGEFKFNSIGFAEVNFANNDKFEGWLDVRGQNPQGFGKYTYKNEDVFIGFVSGYKPDGMGILTQKSGKKLWSENFGKKNAIIPEDASKPLGIAMEETVDSALKKVMDGKTDVLNRANESTSKAETASKNAENKIKELPIAIAQDDYDTALRRAKIENVTTEVGVIGNYKGNVKDEKPHGYGIMTHDGSVYIGSFVDGQKSGLGKETFKSSNVDWKEYIGFFNNDSYSGWGKVTYSNGKVKYGEWHGHKQEAVFYTFTTKETYYNVSSELEEIIKQNIENDVKAVVEKAETAAVAAESAAGKEAKTTESAAEQQYKKAIADATPKADDKITVGEIIKSDGKIKYFGQVKGDTKTWYGYGKIIYSEHSTFTGSFVTDEPKGFGKLEFAEKSDSPLKEYYGFVKGSEPHGIGIGVFRKDNKEEFHMKWNGNKFEESAEDTAADSLVTQIKNDADTFIKRATELSIEKSGWGLKEYGLASAAAGVAAAGLYYAYKKYNQPAKQKQSSKKRSKKRSDHKQSDHKRSSKKRSDLKRSERRSEQKLSDKNSEKPSDQKPSDQKRSKKRSDQKPSERRSERVSAKLRSAPRSNRRSRRRQSI